MLIDVTIDIRDLDPVAGPAPLGASVAFSRLSPTADGATLVTSDAVTVPLDPAGHGTLKLQINTGYLIRCYGFNGFGSSFAVLTGTTATSLAALWKTGQIDPIGFGASPVPQTVEQVLTAQAAAAAATYLAKSSASAVATSGAYTDLTGKPVIPTSPGQVGAEPAGLSPATASSIASQIATAIAGVVAGAPAAFDTLIEIATQLQADETGAAALAATVATKQNAAQVAASIATQAASTAATYVALRGPWVAGTAFPKNSLVIQAGAVYLAAADVPARTTFTASDWQALGGGTAAADLVLTLIGAGVASITGNGLTKTGAGVATANSTLLTSIGGGMARIAA